MNYFYLFLIFFNIYSNVYSASWEQKANLTYDKTQFAAVYYKGLIYAIAGRNNTYNSVNTTLTYNATTNQWKSIINLNRERCNHAAVTYQDEIWVIGGYDWGSEELNSIEIWNGSTWRYGPNLTFARQMLAAAVGGDGRIYVTGGAMAMTSYEIYDPTKKNWIVGPGVMPVGISGHASVGSVDGKYIYMYGGFDGNGYTNKVYALELSTQIWKSLQPMSVTRWALAGVVGQNGLIYAIGGSDGGINYWAQIEAYNVTTGLWSSTNLPPLLYPVYSLAAAIDSAGIIYALGGDGPHFSDPNNYVESWASVSPKHPTPSKSTRCRP